MELLPTLYLTFLNGGTFPNFGFSTTPVTVDPIVTAGCDQIGLLVSVTTSSANAFIRVAWAADNYAANSGLGCYESVAVPGALTSGFQRYTMTPKEFGPIAPLTNVAIWLPTAAHCFFLTVYADQNKAGQCNIAVEMGRTGNPTQS